MAIQTVNFNGRYSDPFQVSGTSLVVRVETPEGGGIILERSITGENFISEKVLSAAFDQLSVIERGISGCVPGQWLRLRFEQCTPSSVTVLQ